MARSVLFIHLLLATQIAELVATMRVFLFLALLAVASAFAPPAMTRVGATRAAAVTVRALRRPSSRYPGSAAVRLKRLITSCNSFSSVTVHGTV